MADEKEPQSYGSGGDWVTGNVGEEVNRLKGRPNSQQGDFYESRHESGTSEQGGTVSPEQIEDNAQPADASEPVGDAPVNKVTAAEGGAKRGGYFKRRDYE